MADFAGPGDAGQTNVDAEEHFPLPHQVHRSVHSNSGVVDRSQRMAVLSCPANVTAENLPVEASLGMVAAAVGAGDDDDGDLHASY